MYLTTVLNTEEHSCVHATLGNYADPGELQYLATVRTQICECEEEHSEHEEPDNSHSFSNSVHYRNREEIYLIQFNMKAYLLCINNSIYTFCIVYA